MDQWKRKKQNIIQQKFLKIILFATFCELDCVYKKKKKVFNFLKIIFSQIEKK
jgi:hypothetical protein